MKILSIILLFTLYCSQAWGVVLIQRESGSDASILFYWGAESTTAEKSGGDTTATLYSGANIDTDFYPVGAASLELPTAYDYAAFDWSSGVIDLDKGRIGFYIKISVFSTNTEILNLTYDAGNYLKIYTYTGNKIRFLWATAGANSNTILTATDSVLADTTYFIEYAYDRANDSTDVFINGVTAGTSSSDMGTGWAGNPSIVKFGNDGGVLGVYSLDQIIISNDNTKDLYAIRNNTAF
jgi:hypothetical protein